MGNSNARAPRKVKHFYFGEVVKKKTYGKEFITVTKPILNESQYNDWRTNYNIAQEMNKDVLFLPDDCEYHSLEKSSMMIGGCCGAEAEVDMTYEEIDFFLESELGNRRQKSRSYKESELLLMLYQLLEGAKEFQKKQLPVGDIRPMNILVTRQGKIKMINIASFPWERTSIEKITDGFDNKTVFYLAPEEVNYLKTQGHSKNQFPNPKTEAWSIGLTLLEASLLDSSSVIYEMPGRKIKDGELESRMQKSRNLYPNLYPFLGSILKIDPSQRMTSGECWAQMRPYSQKITALQEFRRNQVKENESVRKFLTDGSLRH